MNLVALVVGLLQAASWTVSPETVTVGDTVFLTRRIITDEAVQARVEPGVSESAVELLSDPRVSYSEGTVVVRIAMALFESGRHAIRAPDIELVHPDGRRVRVPGDSVSVSVESVLPADDSLPPPRPPIEPMRRSVTRAEPLALLVGLTLVTTIAWGLVRRHPRARPVWPADAPTAGLAPVEEWLGAGEPRAVAAAAAGHLRDAIARADPSVGRQLSTDECVTALEDRHADWPVPELRETLEALDRARFAPAVATDLVALTERADRLASLFGRSEAPER